MLIPILSIVLILLYTKREVGFLYGKYSLMSAILWPSLGIGFRALFAGTLILNYSPLWLPLILICILPTLLLAILSDEFKGFNSSVTFIMAMFFYGSGSCLLFNSYYDNSEPQHFNILVLDKGIKYSGQNRSHKITLAPWKHNPEQQEISVRYKIYKNLEKNSYLHVTYQSGALAMPYYKIIP
jgi:hypothetical protein